MKVLGSIPSVDVIIPVYNTSSDLLEHCVLSALNQTHKKTNVIMVDDGSTKKETLSIIEKYSNNGKISVLRQKNAGVSAARNTGLARSEGDYVLFLDADDYIVEDYIETCIKNANANNSELLINGRIDSETRRLNTRLEPGVIDCYMNPELILFNAHSFVCAGALIDGEKARSERFNCRIAMGEDTDYIVRVMTRCRKIVYTGLGGYYYVRNQNSATKKYDRQSVGSFVTGTNELIDSFRDNLSISEQFLDVYRLIKINSVAIRLFYIFRDRRIFKEKMNSYLTLMHFSKVPMSNIFCRREFSKGQILKMALINIGFFDALYLIFRIKARGR